ncbi:hypothetical protein OIU76_007449 [Salix suchowensis]|nr:hypothetical protein OIU76_007449 [Salix suchowensis]
MALEAFNSPATATPSFQFEDSSLHYMGEPWAKRKRSKRSRLDQQPTEEEYLALCLVMLARGSTNLPIPASDQHPKTPDHPASSIHIIRAKIKLQVLRVQQGVSFLPSPRRAQSKSQKTRWRRRRSNYPQYSYIRPQQQPCRTEVAGFMSALSATKSFPPDKPWVVTRGVTMKAS